MSFQGLRDSVAGALTGDASLAFKSTFASVAGAVRGRLDPKLERNANDAEQEGPSSATRAPVPESRCAASDDSLFEVTAQLVVEFAASLLPADAPELAVPEPCPRRIARPASALIEHGLRQPHERDRALAQLSHALGLSHSELLVVSLACLVEFRVDVGRLVARLQAPLGGSRPTLGWIERWLRHALGPAADTVQSLLGGNASFTGLLTLAEDTCPLAERALLVPPLLARLLTGSAADREHTRAGALHPERHWVAAELDVQPGPSLLQQAQRHARALEGAGRSLIVRVGARNEGRVAAQRVARELGKRALFIEGTPVDWLAPWLELDHLLPVFLPELGPADTYRKPRIAGYGGPVVVVCGTEGSVESDVRAPLVWKLGVPSRAERQQLWQHALAPSTRHSADRSDAIGVLAQQLAEVRHSFGRIATLGEIACQRAALDARAVTVEDVKCAARDSDSAALEAFAEPIRECVTEEALVVPSHIKDELELLRLRCGLGEGLDARLGPSAKTRYRPGIRALFCGPSGTGKTLAASWLGGLLGLPLYRVDTASVMSKYIGETEKNLSQLLARAEHAGVMLLFDEADSLFGKRTDVKQANDRFANTQTNYLLQRVESYEGSIVLTSNSRDRFDEAFTRRLDAIIEFPNPKPAERRHLWRTHLGEHELTVEELNRLAAHVELAGGHIRNVVLCATAIASSDRRAVGWGDVRRALEVEYRKVNKALPAQVR